MRISINLNDRLHKDLRLRFVAYFFITMLVATLLSTVLSYLIFTRNMGRQLTEDQLRIAQSLIGEDAPLPEFRDMLTSDSYNITPMQEDDAVLQKYMSRLKKGEIVMDRHWMLPTVDTYFMIKGEFYKLSVIPNSVFIWQILIGLVTAIVSALLLGTFLASFSGNRFLRPIRDLSRATGEVAKGNFSVNVPMPRNAEMATLVRDFNKMTADLARIEILQRDFTGNVSHELKTPLASIHGFAELLQRDGLSDDERKEYATIIAEESARLSSLAANTLRMSKLDCLDKITDTECFSLDEQLRRIGAIMERQWSQKNITVDFDLAPIDIVSNAEMLGEVWVNILGNAVKFTPAGGHIYVRLQDALDSVIVEIEDDGCGMDEETVKRIFDKFYQGDRSHSGEGNGIGLSIVHRIVQLCGGTVEVESAPGEGTMMRVILPN